MSIDALAGDGRLVGGVAIEARKRQSTARGVLALPMPAQLWLPLADGPGGMLEPQVGAGDRVWRGQPLATGGGALGVTLHASTSGRVREIVERPVADPRRSTAPCVIVEPDGDDRAWSGLAPPDPAQWRDDADIARALAGAGLAGLGGAVYPTGAKVAAGRVRGLRSVILNGAECEPYISCDDLLMRNHADEVLAGALALLALTGAERAYVALEDDKVDALAALEAALVGLDAADRITLVTVPTIYPTGGERQLIQLITGEEVPSGGFPVDLGHLVQNVATAVAVYRFLERGEPLTGRITTVTGGGVAEPANLRVPLGAPVTALVDACGGYTDAAWRLIVGGGMTGLAMAHDDFPVTRATNCVIVAARDEVRTTDDALPCIRCGDCSRACPATLMPQLLHWSAARNETATLQTLGLFDCIECGCCDVVCPSHIPLTEQFRTAKRQLRQANADRQRAEHARARHEARDARLERRTREQEAALAERRAEVQRPEASGEAIADIMARVRRRRSKNDANRDADP